MPVVLHPALDANNTKPMTIHVLFFIAQILSRIL
jgi:hypothetical protein